MYNQLKKFIGVIVSVLRFDRAPKDLSVERHGRVAQL